MHKHTSIQRYEELPVTAWNWPTFIISKLFDCEIDAGAMWLLSCGTTLPHTHSFTTGKCEPFRPNIIFTLRHTHSQSWMMFTVIQNKSSSEQCYCHTPTIQCTHTQQGESSRDEKRSAGAQIILLNNSQQFCHPVSTLDLCETAH